ncbi:toxin-antitoxin system HicB family antitoxin [bacterium]|nr:toxin-antitoxin system HicB family antitoxin [bacterium]
MEYSAELLEEYEQRGVALREPPRDYMEYSGRLLLRMPKYLHRRVSEEASQNGVSLNTYLISILSDSFRTPQIVRKIDRIQECIIKLEHRLPKVDFNFDKNVTIYQKEERGIAA